MKREFNLLMNSLNNVAVLGNPLTDMKRLREVSVVIKNGVVIKQPAQTPAP